MKRVNYNTLYAWENLEDGTYEKFINRLNALPWEVSIKTKLGCGDISLAFYVDPKDITAEMIHAYENAQKQYNLRSSKLEELLSLLKEKLDYSIKVDDEYLYELWIYKIFNIDWQKNPILEMNNLIEVFIENNNVNPLEVELLDNTHEKKSKLGFLKKILKKN